MRAGSRTPAIPAVIRGHGSKLLGCSPNIQTCQGLQLFVHWGARLRDRVQWTCTTSWQLSSTTTSRIGQKNSGSGVILQLQGGGEGGGSAGKQFGFLQLWSGGRSMPRCCMLAKIGSASSTATLMGRACRPTGGLFFCLNTPRSTLTLPQQQEQKGAAQVCGRDAQVGGSLTLFVRRCLAMA